MSKSVVIVEDEFLIAEDFIGMCEEIGLVVLGQADVASDAISLILDKQPDYVLMDVRLKGNGDGVDVALDIYDKLPATKVIFITGSNEPPTIQRIKTDHPYAILIKPVSYLLLKETFDLPAS